MENNLMGVDGEEEEEAFPHFSFCDFVVVV